MLQSALGKAWRTGCQSKQDQSRQCGKRQREKARSERDVSPGQKRCPDQDEGKRRDKVSEGTECIMYVLADTAPLQRTSGVTRNDDRDKISGGKKD